MKKYTDRVITQLERTPLPYLVGISTVVSVAMSELIVSLLSLFFLGYVAYDYLLTGAVTAAVVSFGVVAVIAVFVRKLREQSAELKALNANLEHRVATEIDQRRSQDQLLIQQSRLAAMGEMIGAIAHQWRQPLNVIGIEVQELEDLHLFGELNQQNIREKIERTMRQIDFMSDTINDFRNFFRPAKERVTFDVIQAIREVTGIVSAQFYHNHIHLQFPETEIKEKTFFVSGYPNEFKQVLVNILNNAKDAILEKRADPADTFQGSVEITVTGDGHSVTLRFRDNGPGIPEETLERIFDPYFTTKDKKQGTGIGLYMSKMIIEKNMGGAISAKNGEKGAEFSITLPKNTAETAAE